MSQFPASGGQRIGASASPSVLPMSMQCQMLGSPHASLWGRHPSREATGVSVQGRNSRWGPLRTRNTCPCIEGEAGESSLTPHSEDPHSEDPVSRSALSQIFAWITDPADFQPSHPLGLYPGPAPTRHPTPCSWRGGCCFLKRPFQTNVAAISPHGVPELRTKVDKLGGCNQESPWTLCLKQRLQ